MPQFVILKNLKIQPYIETWQAMRAFTLARTAETPDEIWFVEHPPVFTQGQAGKPEHILDPGNIPVIQTDRGGQVTYHGPGQLVVYFLLDMKRKGFNVRQLVTAIEQVVVDVLNSYGIQSNTKPEAPGVYVGGAKIASLGLRIKRGFTYHGLALNVDMDLEPFTRINPCGFKKLPVTQLADFITKPPLSQVQERFLEPLKNRLQYTVVLNPPNPPLERLGAGSFPRGGNNWSVP